MVPAQPPLPTDLRFPFQWASVGNHTSILISESLDGVRVAWTRQNEGTSLKLAAPVVGVCGAVNCPSATICAEVTEVSGRCSFSNDSQDGAAAASWLEKITASGIPIKKAALAFLIMARASSSCEALYEVARGTNHDRVL